MIFAKMEDKRIFERQGIGITTQGPLYFYTPPLVVAAGKLSVRAEALPVGF